MFISKLLERLMDDVQNTTETVDDDEVTITALDDQDAVRYSFLERWLLNAHLTPKRWTISLRLSRSSVWYCWVPL